MSFVPDTLGAFRTVAEAGFSMLTGGEQLALTLSAEFQDYVRFNGGLIRQITGVSQRRLEGRLRRKQRLFSFSLDLEGPRERDCETLRDLLNHARRACELLPEDPHDTPLEGSGTEEEVHAGTLPELRDLGQSLEQLGRALDLTGFYAGGDQLRVAANSEGTFKSFATRSFFVDFSLYTRDAEDRPKSVKGLYAGRAYSRDDLMDALEASRQKLTPLKNPSRTIPPGTYRVYLEPAAVQALVGMLSWGAVSYGALRRGESAFESLQRGERRLSPLFSLHEDFHLGLTPRFNESGESAPALIPIITEGQLQTLLVNRRTASEYGVASNAASRGETLRAASVAPGSLQVQQVLESLGTGLYLSNLHYLNWSDRAEARVTGMTRHACFWVEDGEVVAPIRDLRFDDSLYGILGDRLEALTRTPIIIPETSSYEARAFGGSRVPGMLVDGLRFTL